MKLDRRKYKKLNRGKQASLSAINSYVSALRL